MTAIESSSLGQPWRPSLQQHHQPEVAGTVSRMPQPALQQQQQPSAAADTLGDRVGRHASLAAASAAAVGMTAAAARRQRKARGAARGQRLTFRQAAAVEDRVAAAEALEEEETMKWRGLMIPMTRVVGLEDIKLALQLAAVDPSLGGVGICGGHGTGKTILARSMRGILPKIEVMKNSICNLDPEKPEEWDALSKERMGGKTETKVVDCPFVELPLGCTEDRLVGSLDVQASMDQGRPVFEPGLLAQAHRGVLYIDDINLLQDDLVSLLLTSVESGVNRVEREGLSVAHPCRPLIVATWNPEEGPLRPHLMDRLAVVLSTEVEQVYTNLDERIVAVDSSLSFSEGAEKAVEEAKEDLQTMETRLVFGRATLDDVTLGKDQMRRIAEEAGRGQCEGHRAEIFAAKVAKAHAALQGRDVVSKEDLQLGIKLAIIPRIRVSQEQMEEQMEQPPPPPPPPPPQQEEEDLDNEDMDEPPPELDEEEDQEPPEQEEDDGDQEEMQEEVPEEFMISAEGAVVDDDLLKFQNKSKASGRSGARSKIYSMDRGRYVKAMLPKGGDSKSGKIALDATLRNAVVFQKMRREEAARTLPKERQKTVYVEKGDIWVKKMARKAGALVIFIVDASGSMALNRMQNAKGAVLRLLESAYQNRDQVCLIPCRGIRADVLVPPTSSVARASRSMQVLPCGGGTPLAHAMSQAINIGENALSSKDVGQVCLVAITDGRANVPLAVSEGDADAVDENGRMKKVPKEDLQAEIMVFADRLRNNNNFKFLLIDTENKYVSSGIAKELAERADGRYYYLPRADDKSIAEIAGGAVMEMKGR